MAPRIGSLDRFAGTRPNSFEKGGSSPFSPLRKEPQMTVKVHITDADGTVLDTLTISTDNDAIATSNAIREALEMQFEVEDD
jgi:hypothetical protein